MEKITRRMKKSRNNRLHVFRKFRESVHFELAAASADIFYNSLEWKRFRLEALAHYGRICVSCGAGPQEAILHVDHIKPRFLYPELALRLKNMQILCGPCNQGKGLNKNDFRPKTIIRRGQGTI
jgi:5-methylcytosine-specific restriction endonuclease McrA